MRRKIPNLSTATRPPATGSGLYLVSVEQVRHRWQGRKPYYLMRFRIEAPQNYAGTQLLARVSCDARDLWRLQWLLRDFGCESEVAEDELDEKRLLGKRGVIKISNVKGSGRTYVSVEACAPAAEWSRFSSSRTRRAVGPEAA